MSGSVIKERDRWYVKIELDPDPGTGRRRQKWHSGYRTRRDAERARVDLLSKFDRGEYVEPSSQTVAAFLSDWLTAIEPTVRPSTFDSYRRNVRLHVVPHIGTVRLSRVDAGALNGLYALLLASGRQPSSRKGAGYSPTVLQRAQELRAQGTSLTETAKRLRAELPEAERITKDTLASLLRRASATGERVDTNPGLDRRTVNYVHTILHRAFKDAVRWGRLARNPADAADPPRAGQKSHGVHAWDAATLRQFLARVLLQIGSVVSVGEPKTGKGRRSISFDSSTVAVLRDHRHRMRQERLLVGAVNGLGLVFHQPDGSWLRPEAVSEAFLRRSRRYDRPRITLHGLRHTWATLALERGIHPKVVQERLGHSTIAITLGIYSHVSPTLHDEAAELVAELVLSPPGPRGKTT